MAKKFQHLKEILTKMGSVLVAYSGGVDSTFLLKFASNIIDDKKVVAVTAESLTFPSGEINFAKKMAKQLGVKHIIIKTEEFKSPKFINNPEDRCYWCKKELFLKLTTLAKRYKLNYVLDGSNYDDIRDFRPGMKAAKEFGVRSPLKEAGLTKDEIRSFSKKLGLPTWDKPSFACLASRFPYGMRITKEGLIRVDKAEAFLRNFGISQVRVRQHNNIARIEVLKEQIPILLKKETKEKIVSKFRELGYSYVTVDLEGYRTGSLNPVRKKFSKRH